MRERRRERAGHDVIVVAAAACFFLSGMAGLVYEVVWMRLLGLVFGHTVYAITTVLAAYMGGLALGSVLLGRRADRLKRPLRVYGLLEAAIGLYCIATPLLFRITDAAYLWAHAQLQPSPSGAAALHLVLAGALLLPPTTLMGATLPILSRAVVRSRHVAGAQVGMLYAVNTWGAVAGTVGAGFLLLPAVGVRATTWVAVVLNLLVAAIALLVDRSRAGRIEQATPPDPPTSTRAGRDLTPVQVGVTLLAIGISGAASMSYEIAWTRALSLVLGSSTYAFTAMLATFLVGLALGALIVSRWLRTRRPGLAVFGFVEIAAALSVLAMLPYLGRLPDAVLLVLRQTGVSYSSVLWTQVGLSFTVMIVPIVLVGATFPLVVAVLDRGLDRLGRDVGAIYAANTVGTIVGSIVTGFVLIRTLGIQATVIAAATANLAVGVAVVWIAPEARRRQRAAVGAAAAAFAAIALAIPHWDPNVMTAGVGVYAGSFLQQGRDALREFSREREMLFYDEGISTTVAVTRDHGGTVLSVNGKADASNDADMQTQLLLGHLGPLLQPELRRALIVGLGSGVTAGAVAQHPLEVIDVAELEPSMVEASRFFVVENRNVLADPRVRVVEGDGRSILATAAEPYDLIISEPSNPWIAGVANLFTLDFYRAARERLSSRGVFVQWLQNYAMFPRDMQMVVRTFQEVFPHVSIWAATPNDYLLVATPEPLHVDHARIERRLASSAALSEDFDRFHGHGGDLVFRFVLGEEDALRYGRGAPLNTDDRPILEFSAPLALYAAAAEESAAVMRSFRTVERPPVSGLDPATFTGPRGHLRAGAVLWLMGHVAEARHALERAGPAAALPPALALERGRLLLLLGEVGAAREELTALARALSSDPLLRRYLRAAEVASHPRVAAQLSAAGRDPPRGVLGELFMTLAREQKDPDLYEVALELLAADAVLSPGSYLTANNHAGLLYEMGRYAEAEKALSRAVLLNPALASTHFNRGLVLERLGRGDDAMSSYEQAWRIDPTWPKLREHLTSLRIRLESARR